jgi:2-polyprenyl-3-methyl-5-hydroxy-6-metoxy-1,4-benzoquinol methylase
MNSYRKLAHYYDMLGWAVFSNTAYKKLTEFIAAKSRHAGSILDIACGTGTLAYKLAHDGYEVWGIDLSSDMIQVARAKREKAKVTFRRADMRNARLGRRFDLVTCFFDSLNHCMTPEELQSSFETAHRHLNPGGYFLFDMNTLAGLKNWYVNDVRRTSKYTLTRSGFFNEETKVATVAIEAFVKRGNLYDRLFEVFHETAYPDSVIKKSLRETGFRRVRIKPFADGYIGEKPPRIWVEAQR